MKKVINKVQSVKKEIMQKKEEKKEQIKKKIQQIKKKIAEKKQQVKEKIEKKKQNVVEKIQDGKEKVKELAKKGAKVGATLALSGAILLGSSKKIADSKAIPLDLSPKMEKFMLKDNRQFAFDVEKLIKIKVPDYSKIKNREERIKKTREFVDFYVDYLFSHTKLPVDMEEAKKHFKMILEYESGMDPLRINWKSKDYGVGQLHIVTIYKLKRGLFIPELAKVFKNVPIRDIMFNPKYNVLGAFIVYVYELLYFRDIKKAVQAYNVGRGNAIKGKGLSYLREVSKQGPKIEVEKKDFTKDDGFFSEN